MKKGFILGLIASLITFSGDMLLGYIQVENPEKLLMNFSLTLPLSRILWGGFLGVIGIPLQCIGYWQIYKLMKEGSKTLSKLYNVGIWGWLVMAACGVHLNCAVVMLIYKQLYSTDAILAHNVATTFSNALLLHFYRLFSTDEHLTVHSFCKEKDCLSSHSSPFQYVYRYWHHSSYSLFVARFGY